LDRLKERRQAHIAERDQLVARVAMLNGAIAELNDDIREIETGITASDAIARICDPTA
jgi:cell division protein FtsB